MRTCFAVVVAALAASAELALVPLRDSLAVCTDGSQAGYYWKSGAKKSKLWIVYLEGGGWCWDKDSCNERCGTHAKPNNSTMCSSNAFLKTRPLSGIFSPVQDRNLARAHKIFVPYCTSDGHMGNATAMGRHFRGAAVIQSVLRAAANRGLGAAPGDQLLFGGTSAGGRGAMVHLDYVREMLGSAGRNVEVLGVLDSPLWIDIKPFSKTFVGFDNITSSVHSYIQNPHLDQLCLAQNRGFEWHCMFGQYRMPFLRTPYIVYASQYDAYQLGNNVGHEPVTWLERAYAEEFARRTKQLVGQLKADWRPSPIQAGRVTQNAVFSWACYNHAVSTWSEGFDELSCTAKHVTEHAALSQFLRSGVNGGPLEWVDQCTGFECGMGCSAVLI